MDAKSGHNDGQFRQIVAQKITIVNDDGQELMLFGTSDEGTGLSILNKACEKVLSLGINADERGTGKMIADKRGKNILALGGDARGYGLVIMEGN